MEPFAVTPEDFEAGPEHVRARFKWALQRGNPLWLWPDTSPQRWQAALEEIESATHHILADMPGQATICADPTDFGIAAFTSGMGPLLGYWAERGLIEAESAVLHVLAAHLDHNTERMERLRGFAQVAVEALSLAGLNVLVLKGMHTAYSYFPVPGARPLADIDLFVGSSAADVAGETLRSLGYSPDPATVGEQTWRLARVPPEPVSLSLVHRDGPWSIDLHTSMDRRYSPGARPVQLDRVMDLRKSTQWTVSPRGLVLAGADLVHCLACHASLGLTNLSLLRLTELVLVIRRLEAEDGLSWSRLIDLAERTGSPGSSYPALLMANQLVPHVVPNGVLQMLERNAPATVRRVLASLTPATCQRIRRCSLTERFMWTETPGGWVREVWGSLFPPVSYRELVSIYRLRAAYLLRGAVTR